MTSGDAVQQIKDKLNILDVIAPYVELQRAGKNFKGKCPFHAEKTPSFNVSPDRGMYHCYGCGVGGDIFNFVQEIEAIEFKEALKILAQKAGVELIPEDPKRKTERERLYAAVEAATVFYQDELTKEPGASEYLKRRGVTTNTVAAWQIGYAPGPPHGGWRETKDHLEAKSFTREELFKAGLIKQTDTSKEPFDVFRDRIMFPMAEPSGRTVAFSGRILHPDEKSPKYVNSPETVLYKKSELLFGYDKAKQGIRQLKFSLIVEGQFDVVMCHQAGYTNAVAVSGTALTVHHVQLLERLSDKVVLALDADQAGVSAMKKAAELMLSRGLDVKVAELPAGKDPADIIAEDPTRFKKVIGTSTHVIDFLLRKLRHETEDDRKFLLVVKKEVYPIANIQPGQTERYALAKLIAAGTNVPVDVVWRDMEDLRQRHTHTVRPPAERKVSSVESQPVLQGQVVPERAYGFLVGAMDVLDNELQKPIRIELEEIKKISSLAEPTESERVEITFRLEQLFEHMPTLAIQEEVVARLNQLRTGLLRKQLNEVRKELQAAEASEDEAAFTASIAEIQEYETLLRAPAYQVETLFLSGAEKS